MVELLLNLMFLLVSLLLLQLVVDHKRKFTVSNQIIFYVFAFGVISCISVPVFINEEFIYDLRHIPVWLGSLYGGPIVGGLLFGVTVIYRSFFGGIGTYTTIIITAIQFVIAFVIYKRFIQLDKAMKIVLSTSLAVFSGVLSLVIVSIVASKDVLSITFLLEYVSVQALGMLIVSYIFEVMRQNLHFRREIMESEKQKIVSHLSAAFSHEVRNPMTTTRGFLQLLSQDDDLPRDKQKQFLKLAMEELDRSEAIISSYLTFAKPAVEKVDILNLKQEIERAVNIITPLANMTSIEIDLHLIPISIKGNSQQFQQVLINLMKNAVEAMNAGGQLSIKTIVQSNLIILYISDTGCGMTKEQVKRLGQPYFTTKDQKGTGLGMMVTYSIVENMDGSIEVESEHQKGTTFKVTLPRVHCEAEIS